MGDPSRSLASQEQDRILTDLQKHLSVLGMFEDIRTTAVPHHQQLEVLALCRQMVDAMVRRAAA